MKRKLSRLRKIFVIILILVLSCVVVLMALIKQPVFIKYKDENISVPSVLSDQTNLEDHVKFLSTLDRASAKGQKEVHKYITSQLEASGIEDEKISRETYLAGGEEYQNIRVKFGQKTSSTTEKTKYIIGAHYDSFDNFPCADDNATGVAGLLEIARVLAKTPLEDKEIELVFYSTEEQPFFAMGKMGSSIHANNVADKENIKLMISLEMIGYFSEEENSQELPLNILKFVYPSEGNFITVVSNLQNTTETKKVKNIFSTFLKRNNLITVDSMNAPDFVPGVGWSDHRNYWEFDIPAVMITDTAFYRNKNYHTPYDTYEKLNYKKMKEVVDATMATIFSF